MSGSPSKGLMRSLGEFVGHIVKAVRTDPVKPGESDRARRASHSDPPNRVEVNRTTEVREENDLILRRTTIDEIEVKRRAET